MNCEHQIKLCPCCDSVYCTLCKQVWRKEYSSCGTSTGTRPEIGDYTGGDYVPWGTYISSEHK